jgi:hypothetical protein
MQSRTGFGIAAVVIIGMIRIGAAVARHSTEQSRYDNLYSSSYPSSASNPYLSAPPTDSHANLAMPILADVDCADGRSVKVKGDTRFCARADGVPDGYWQKLDSTRTVVLVDGEYQHGKREGHWYYYGIGGSFERDEWYQNDQLTP